MLVFEERGKPEYPEKNLSEQGREPTTNSTRRPCDDTRTGSRTQAILVGGEYSALTTAPPLLPDPDYARPNQLFVVAFFNFVVMES